MYCCIYIYRIEGDADDEVPGDDIDEQPEMAKNEEDEGKSTKPRISWLLQVVFEYLGVNVNKYSVCNVPSSPFSPSLSLSHLIPYNQSPKQQTSSIKTRHQCMQILNAMVRHIDWVANDLDLVATALQRTLNDDDTSIQLCAAQCVDTITNAINLRLLALSNQSNAAFDELLHLCFGFWVKMIPSMGECLQDWNQSTTLKSTLCDAFSNIGVHIFERLEVCSMQVFSKHAQRLPIH